MTVSRNSRFTLLAALGAFVVANLIHNRGGIDVAIAPGVVFTALVFWKPRRVFLILGALMLGGPAIAFFKWAALTDPSRQAYFINHVSLLLTAILAFAALATGVMPNRRSSGSVAPQQTV